MARASLRSELHSSASTVMRGSTMSAPLDARVSSGSGPLFTATVKMSAAAPACTPSGAFSTVDGDTLQDVQSWNDSKYIVGCITVYCGKTPIRLIDHIKYKG